VSAEEEWKWKEGRKGMDAGAEEEKELELVRDSSFSPRLLPKKEKNKTSCKTEPLLAPFV